METINCNANDSSWQQTESENDCKSTHSKHVEEAKWITKKQKFRRHIDDVFCSLMYTQNPYSTHSNSTHTHTHRQAEKHLRSVLWVCVSACLCNQFEWSSSNRAKKAAQRPSRIIVEGGNNEKLYTHLHTN